MNPHEQFREEVKENIEGLQQDKALQATSLDWVGTTAKHKYTYNFSWMGRPIIQLPQDMIAMQEIIWSLRPDIIVESGIAHGGSLMFYASMLELIGHGEVLGIDIDIRPHNREAIEAHPMSKRIQMIEGSSIDPAIVDQVRQHVEGKKVHGGPRLQPHPRARTRRTAPYAPLISVGSYCVVMDTVVEDMPEDAFPDRPWGKGDNPKTAVWAYLEENRDFEIDQAIHSKLLITVAPDGYLRRVR